MNDIIENMISRRSIRAFKPELPSGEILDEIMRAGSFAATGRNFQSPLMICITQPDLLRQLRVLNAQIMGKDDNFDPFYGAPAVIVVLADKSRPTYLYDGSLVMGNLMLAAHSLGLGSCWIHRAKEEFETPWGKKILSGLGITGDYEGIGHCAIGYAAGEMPPPPPRKNNYVYKIK